ncbi:hypothetical protein L6452_37689 [Arctium lappa]|uniref:Uncharacterized protein n=1 Tax=Arctium lappa TaxID=4217 RepID=A0ACB8Y3M9_ARCLA|nr:hypothetical protein L6452_37689 [Arctium lappa]
MMKKKWLAFSGLSVPFIDCLPHCFSFRLRFLLITFKLPTHISLSQIDRSLQPFYSLDNRLLRHRESL